MMNDLARYLGCLHDADAQEIIYGDKIYTWNPEAAGNLKGSNWYSDATLVSVITKDFQLGLVTDTLNLKIDGVNVAMKLN